MNPPLEKESADIESNIAREIASKGFASAKANRNKDSTSCGHHQTEHSAISSTIGGNSFRGHPNHSIGRHPNHRSY